ncbi:MAG: phosphatidylserine/phosphatidylglycerophosphate/cardiolipin synthase family protein [Haloarculaceae archaeon]
MSRTGRAVAVVAVGVLLVVGAIVAAGSASGAVATSADRDPRFGRKESPAGPGTAVWTRPLAPTVESPPLDPTAGSASLATNATRAAHPSIVAVYPNPVVEGDRAEFVVLRVPFGTNLGAYRLGDGETRLGLPNATAGGRIALTGAPAAVGNLTDARTLALGDSLSLANAGERLTLVRDNETIAAARYRDAPEGEVGRFDRRRTITWRPVGRTDRPVVTARGGRVRAFVLPDAPDAVLSLLDNATDRIRLAGYTFTSQRVARTLERAARRGVDVRVLLEGGPVDGITHREARLLDSLAAAGVDVRLLGAPPSRYAFHHPKYAVVDDRAVVLTENWKPAGTGGRSSRGWGVVLDQPRIVAGLVETFRADANWTGAAPWRRFRRGRSFSTGGVANGSYERRHPPETLPVNRTRLLVAPDNAGREVTAVLRNATESIDVVQMRIDGPDGRFVRAAVDAARRGVAVRILLSGAWYVREDNRRLVEHLRERADREDLPLRAKLAEPGGRYEKIHAKGVVVDGDQVLLGSLNWNRESVRNNREVVVQLDGEAVGSYYRAVFAADWNAGGGPPRSIPLGSLAAVAGVVVLALLVARRVEFGGDAGVGPGR